MAQHHELITAAQLDAMTPNERLAAFEKRIVTDLDGLPEEFRARVVASAERLGRERRATQQG